MSATGRGGKRDVLDRYYTPGPLAESLTALLPIKPSDRVVEPSCGGGAFVRALLRRTPRVHAFDLDPRARGLASTPFSTTGNFLVQPTPETGFDWCVGNPPYGHAERHVIHSLRFVREGGSVAFLLRLAFLEGQKRIGFWRRHPARRVFVLAERPSFTGGGTDSAAYGFFVWQKGWQGETALRVVSWRGDRERALSLPLVDAPAPRPGD